MQSWGMAFEEKGLIQGFIHSMSTYAECFPWDLVLLVFSWCLALSRFLWLEDGTSLHKLSQKWGMASKKVEGRQGRT